MSRQDHFSGLAAFLAVAEHASFRAAAAELGVTRAAVSQAIQALERRVGQPLFQRTTRSVALTDAGHQLLRAARPASQEIEQVLEQLAESRRSPMGRLRLSVPRIAVDLVLTPVMPAFRAAYPDISVEFDVDDTSVDLSSRRYDAGVRIGEFVARDMVAVKLTQGFQWMVVGSPDYFAQRTRPRAPRELMSHECIRYRFPTAASVYRWEFSKGGRDFSIEPPGRITVNDHLTMNLFARQGLGLAYTADLLVADQIEAGGLVPVLQPFLAARQGLFLYFPSNAQKQPKLRAFIDVATGVLRSPPSLRDGPPPAFAAIDTPGL